MNLPLTNPCCAVEEFYLKSNSPSRVFVVILHGLVPMILLVSCSCCAERNVNFRAEVEGLQMDGALLFV